MIKDDQLNMKVSAADKRGWEEDAKERNMTLSDYVRFRLNDCKKTEEQNEALTTMYAQVFKCFESYVEVDQDSDMTEAKKKSSKKALISSMALVQMSINLVTKTILKTGPG